MAEVAKAYVTVMPSAKGFSRALGNEIDGTFVAAGRRGGQSIGDEAGKSGGKSFAAAGAKLAGAFAVAFAAVGATAIVKSVSSYVMDAIGSASELEQAIGATTAIYADQTQRMISGSEAAAEALGLSKQAYLELANLLGASLKNLGIEDFAGESERLVGIGADLAAQFGGSTADAVATLSAVMRGEYDSIERYGISLSENVIKAEAVRLGLVETGKEIDTSIRARAALSLVTRQSADAEGAFARESETLAGQQARLNAELENVKTEIGTALIPVVSDLLAIFRDEGVPRLKELAAWFTENKDQVYAMGQGVAEAGLVFLDALFAMGEGAAEFHLMMVDIPRSIVTGFFAMAANIVNAAQIAFGWIPGVGEKLDGLEADLTAAGGVADSVFTMMEGDARQARDMFASGRDAVGSLREAVQNLDGERATVYLNAQGSAMELFQRAPGLTPEVIPGRATGGPVTAGRPYIVGEREAELFVPSQSGVILNRQQIAAAAGGGFDGPPVQMNVYPQPYQSEQAIGNAAGRQLAWQMQGRIK